MSETACVYDQVVKRISNIGFIRNEIVIIFRDHGLLFMKRPVIIIGYE